MFINMYKTKKLAFPIFQCKTLLGGQKKVVLWIECECNRPVKLFFNRLIQRKRSGPQLRVMTTRPCCSSRRRPLSLSWVVTPFTSSTTATRFLLTKSESRNIRKQLQVIVLVSLAFFTGFKFDWSMPLQSDPWCTTLIWYFKRAPIFFESWNFSFYPK